MALDRRLTPRRRGRVLLALLLVVVIVSGCGLHTRSVSATGDAVPPPGNVTRYADAVRIAADLGLGVWLEADLVRRWRAGPIAMDDGVNRLAQLAADRRVIGFKIADELGSDDGLESPAELEAFLSDASSRLRKAAPGRKILIDLIVPELGCAPATSAVRDSQYCAARVRDRYPAVTLQAVDGIFASGTVDVVDLSTGLLSDSSYRKWGLDRVQAQRAAWDEVRRRGWEQHVEVHSRKALAHPGAYAGTAAQAQADAITYIDIPSAAGARAVDIWTWRQQYRGEVVRLTDPGLASNPLWAALRERRDRGRQLITHFTPSSVEVSVTRDLEMLATVFRQVFIAAGTG